MKIAFRFENGSSQLILTPTDSRDKTQLDLCLNGRPEIHLKATNDNSFILEFTEPMSVVPEGHKVVDHYDHAHIRKSIGNEDRCLCNGVGCNTCEPQGRG
jgi:hypothetical protein